MLCQSLGPTLWCVFFPDSCTLEMQLYIEEADSELQALLPPTSALWNLALRLANTEVRPQAEYISLASLELRILHLPCLAMAPGTQGALEATFTRVFVMATSRHAAPHVICKVLPG